MNNIITGLPVAITKLIEAYEILIIIYALLSWFPGAYESTLGRLITRVVAPFINIIERFIPPIMGISFSPVIAFFILEGLERLIWVIL